MDVKAVVSRIAETLGKRALFIGEVAVEAYVAYRSTHDIELIVRGRDLYLLKDLLEEGGFKYRHSEHLEKHVFKGRDVGEVDAYSARVGMKEVTDSLFDRGRSLSYGDVRIWVVGLEDLISLKLAASREMDLADVGVLLLERREEIDTDLLEALVGHEALRQTAVLLPDVLPMEYGWLARQHLKEWLRGKSWVRYG